MQTNRLEIMARSLLGADDTLGHADVWLAEVNIMDA